MLNRFDLKRWLYTALLTLMLPAVFAQQSPQEARDAAITAGAQQSAEALLADGDEALGKARRYRERGETLKAQEQEAEATQLFLDAELTAIQTTVLYEAREALKDARSARAKRYAPITLDRAEDLLGRAAQTLNEDRTRIEEATDLADEAAATARLATQIVRIARDKTSTEDLVLQHASSIWTLQSAAQLVQEADQNRTKAVEDLAAEIARLRASEARLREDLSDSREFAAALEEEIRILDKELGGATAERRELVMRIEEQERKREQLTQAQNLFLEQEAQVFQQSEVIIARLIGLQFASGSAKLSDEYDTFFAKIKKLLMIYPNADVMIEGHTDSKGSDRLNMRLSQNRAQSVMERLINDQAAAPDKLSAMGYGETRPIANNETEEGRAQNRRIDLVIRPAD